MSIVDRFAAYAAAFEDAYTSDDWSKLDPFFTEDAAYETFEDPPASPMIGLENKLPGGEPA